MRFFSLACVRQSIVMCVYLQIELVENVPRLNVNRKRYLSGCMLLCMSSNLRTQNKRECSSSEKKATEINRRVVCAYNMFCLFEHDLETVEVQWSTAHILVHRSQMACEYVQWKMILTWTHLKWACKFYVSFDSCVFFCMKCAFSLHTNFANNEIPSARLNWARLNWQLSNGTKWKYLKCTTQSREQQTTSSKCALTHSTLNSTVAID